jgi:hypothetical protein
MYGMRLAVFPAAYHHCPHFRHVSTTGRGHISQAGEDDMPFNLAHALVFGPY